MYMKKNILIYIKSSLFILFLISTLLCVDFLNFEFNFTERIKDSFFRVSIINKDQIKLLFMGDCFILPPRKGVGFPELVANEISVKTGRKVSVSIKGYGGTSSGTISSQVNGWMKLEKYDFVFTSFGIGDFLNNFKHQDTFWGNVRSYIQNTSIFRKSRIANATNMQERQLLNLKFLKPRISFLENKLRSKRLSDEERISISLYLARHYEEEDSFEDYKQRAILLLKSVKAMRPKELRARQELAYLMCLLDLCDETENILKDIVAIDQNKKTANDSIVTLHSSIRFNNEKIFPALSYNYNNIILKIYKNGATPIPIQHPTRKVSILKEIIHDFPLIKCVDNEKYFKDAIRKYGYKKLFSDRMLGNSGNLTARGHKLMANNIIAFLKKEYFKEILRD